MRWRDFARGMKKPPRAFRHMGVVEKRGGCEGRLPKREPRLLLRGPRVENNDVASYLDSGSKPAVVRVTTM